MKRFLMGSLVGLMTIFALSVVVIQNRNAFADLLNDTALTLRVNTVGTSTSPQNLATAQCNPGDQYYACSTYTTQNSLKLGAIRIDFNGTPGFIPVYAQPR